MIRLAAQERPVTFIRASNRNRLTCILSNSAAFVAYCSSCRKQWPARAQATGSCRLRA